MAVSSGREEEPLLAPFVNACIRSLAPSHPHEGGHSRPGEVFCATAARSSSSALLWEESTIVSSDLFSEKTRALFHAKTNLLQLPSLRRIRGATVKAYLHARTGGSNQENERPYAKADKIPPLEIENGR